MIYERFLIGPSRVLYSVHLTLQLYVRCDLDLQLAIQARYSCVPHMVPHVMEKLQEDLGVFFFHDICGLYVS